MSSLTWTPYVLHTYQPSMHTCLLLDPSILQKSKDLGSLAIQPGEPPPLPHKYMGDGGSPISSPRPPVPDLLTSVLQPSTSGGHLRSQQTIGRIRATQGMASTASHAATTVTSRGVGIDCPDAVWRALLCTTTPPYPPSTTPSPRGAQFAHDLGCKALVAASVDSLIKHPPSP